MVPPLCRERTRVRVRRPCRRMTTLFAARVLCAAGDVAPEAARTRRRPCLRPAMATASCVAAPGLLSHTVPPWPRRVRRCGAKCAASPGPSSHNPLGGGAGPLGNSLSGSRLEQRLDKVTSTGRWGRGAVDGVEGDSSADGKATAGDDALAAAPPGGAGPWAAWQRVFETDEETERVVAGLEVRFWPGSILASVSRGLSTLRRLPPRRATTPRLAHLATRPSCRRRYRGGGRHRRCATAARQGGCGRRQALFPLCDARAFGGANTRDSVLRRATAPQC